MDDAEFLRRLGVNDAGAVESFALTGGSALDPRTLALVRLGALVAVGAPDASLRAQVDDAVGAGVTDAEMIAVLAGIMSVVGCPRVVAAAPKLTLALGYESDLPLFDE